MALLYGRNRNIVVNIIYPEGVTGEPKVNVPSGRTFAQIVQYLPKPEKVDFRLDHWSLTLDGEAIDPNTKVTSGMTFYPVYVNNVCYITFDLQGGQGNVPQQKVTKGQTWGYVKGLINNPTLTGHNFGGFSENISGSALSDEYVFNVDTITIYALWTPYNFTITFNVDGGTPQPSNIPIRYGTTWGQIKAQAGTLTKEGYTFANWSMTQGGPAISDEHVFLDVDNATITVYAVFTLNQYTVTVNANGGTGSVASLAVNHFQTWGEVKSQLQAPSKTGYNFLGWTLVLDGALIEDGYVFTSAVEIFAKYEIIRVTVSFNANGGTPTPEAQVVDYGTTWAQIKDSVQNPSKEGYTFLGWEVS